MDWKESSYGVKKHFAVTDEYDEKILELRIRGYTTLESEFSEKQIAVFAESLERAYENQVKRLGEDLLRKIGDANTVRTPLAEDFHFVKTAVNSKLMLLAKRYLDGAAQLIMQNGLINRMDSGNQQGKWHRDLNYQHWVCTRPIAMNALLVLDDFTESNGATWVVPASHHIEELPSEQYINMNKIQILAKKGEYVILDAMLFHAAGLNKTINARRAINHVIGRPFMAQQINIPFLLSGLAYLTEEEREFLGFRWKTFEDSDSWRKSKNQL
jgi:ectoine hydroxylase-related dioxygenase (phytanoyl-CoA dioxygenase family)